MDTVICLCKTESNGVISGVLFVKHIGRSDCSVCGRARIQYSSSSSLSNCCFFSDFHKLHCFYEPFLRLEAKNIIAMWKIHLVLLIISFFLPSFLSISCCSGAYGVVLKCRHKVRVFYLLFYTDILRKYLWSVGLLHKLFVLWCIFTAKWKSDGEPVTKF